MRGKFISVEGCEGSGKSTQLRLLSASLEKEGARFIVTREPGGSEISEAIRKIILNGAFSGMCAECEALLYAAARVQHLREKILPALDAGVTVVCDRYVDSSLAYQGYARGLGFEYVESINALAMENQPDLTLFLDIDPVAAFSRKHGADEGDRIEQEGLDFHEKVYEGYKALTKRFSRIYSVDCSGTKAETADKIWNVLKMRELV